VPARLSAPEAQALAFAAMPGAAAELGVGALAAAAHLKVLTAVSPGTRDTIGNVLRCFHLDPRGWFRAVQPEHPHLPELARAVWESRQVEAVYRRARGTSRPRVLGPLGLVLKDGLWYLAARAPDDVKTFRVSRFEAVTLADEPVERPADFDLATWWEQWSDDFETGLNQYPVTLRVAPDAVERVARTGETKRTTPEPDGWYRVDVLFEREEFAESALLRFGADVEVMDPPELRHRLEVTSATLFALYHRA
jgi:predicted DNA-binding transcriptional regulator YafY